ncbi:MAG: phenylalanine racemase [Schwartzia succinivorans]|uniref:amino acid adenylation domain-containing protein n=1 Tax=Schwartzia succinivorans TaxID=55507 RepID=UPI0023545B77|nr:amino acid adenylation domain-containing protein [Schwartzia succinivorans]MBE6096535.1 phenylalanine racemase [Schwartzia succinivorans]
MRKSLVAEFDKCYKEWPEKAAVIDGKSRITFAELAAYAMNLADVLLTRLEGVRNTPIAVFLPKCEASVKADVAVLYSCNPFMNLDVKLPKTRLENILNSVKPAVILTTSSYADALPKTDIAVILLDELEISLKYSDETHNRIMTRMGQLIDTDPFCLINTSGSTGTPKGVVLNHRSFFDFHDWAVETFGFNGEEVIGSLSPNIFDIYDFELCLLMLDGSSMVLLDASLAVFPVRLLQAVSDNNVNFIFWVPTIMVNIANKDLLSKIDVSCLKTVWFAGEVFPTKQFNYWKHNLPNTTFANLYGPIEITLDCIYYVVDREFADNEPLPIGIPCNNTDVLLLNEDDKLCGIKEAGEICVRGTSLAMGYYNNPEKTAAAFVQNPLNHSYPELIYRTGDLGFWGDDGLIHFKGRKDSLVKHMGYRIELGEIEHIAVNTLKIVPNCCVVYDKAKKAITMIYEKANDVSDIDIKKALEGHLPRYMVPSKYVQMELLPRNTNGKIDRLKLSQMINREE